MTKAITKNNEHRVVRPLKVLAPLIQRDVENAKEAGKIFYIAAGKKLTEAKSQCNHGEWGIWVEDNFEFSQQEANIWIRWAENETRNSFSSREEFLKHTQPSRRKLSTRKYRDYQPPVDRILSGISAKEMAERAATAAKEHVLEKNLALKLIGIGYKVLSIKLHPDKGGSHDAMRRLNRVRAKLKEAYE
jgi:hypothetical protein